MSENNIVNPNAEPQESLVSDQTTETAETTASSNESAPVAVQEPVAEVLATAHDDFDWSIDKRNVSHYAKDEREKYDSV
jgi:small subunit ribosomal protein S1